MFSEFNIWYKFKTNAIISNIYYKQTKDTRTCEENE